MHIFVCHYTKLKDRKKHMINEIKKTGIGYSFIEKFDQEDLGDDLIERYFKNKKDEWKLRTDFLSQKNTFKNLKKSEMSLILKHCNCYSKIISNNLSYSVILEDDVVLEPNFNEKIKEVINLKKDWDIIWLGTKINHNIIMDDDTLIQKSFHPSSHYSWAYLISNKAAKKILQYIDINKFALPIDWELSWLTYKLNLNVYWFKKPIVNSDIFKSSIGHN